MKKIGLIIVAIMLMVFATILVACNNAGNDGNDGGVDNPAIGPSGGGTSQPAEPDKNAQIESILNGEVSGVECTLEVSPTTEYIDLSGCIKVSTGCSWQLYQDVLGQVNIPTKYAANLANGYNTYYIVVTSEDGKINRTYTLNIWKNFYVDIQFVSAGQVVKTLTGTTHTYIANAEFISVNRTGYTHTGWTNHTDGEDYYITGYDSSYSDLQTTIIFEATFTAHNFTITLDSNGGSCCEDSADATYGSYFALPVPSKTGHTFEGWEYNGTKLTHVDGSSVVAYNYAQNITAEAKWTLNSHQLTINRSCDGGTVTSSGKRNYGESVTITATTNAGYTWVGWYDENGTKVTDALEYTFSMPDRNVTYTAKWEVGAEMKNFEFTSTTTTCTITGIKDTTLTSIIIPDSVTTIGDYAFYNCDSLTSVTIGDNVTTIGDGAFFGCYGLAEVYNYSSLNITKGSEEYGCVAYYALDVYTTNEPSKLTTDKNGFVIHTNGNVKTFVRYIGAETEITIPDNVTTIGSHAFYGCSSLTSITVPFVGATLNGTSNTHFGYIFGASSYRSNKEYVPNSLKTVIITGGTTIGKYAFNSCDSLTSITILDSVTAIGDSAFYGCTGLKDVYYTGGIAGWCGISFESAKANPMYYADNLHIDGKLVEDLVIPDSVTTIGTCAFYNCTSLTSITIPDSVTTIGSSAFYDCDGLTNVTFGENSQLTTIGVWAFHNCDNLTSVTFEDPNGWYITITEGATSGADLTLTNASTNATYLTDTYYYYYWYKK